MRYLPFVLLLTFSSFFLEAINVERSVVRICAKKSYQLGEVWQAPTIFGSVGTGFVVASNTGSKFVLTNAHVVSGSVYITVSLKGFSKTFVAEPFVIGHEYDLALLEVKDPEFSLLSEPVTLGPEIEEGQEVMVIGYSDFDNAIFTKGVASESHYTPYFYSGAFLHCVRIDAAVNAGSSGGPVIHRGKVVGVVFQKLSSCRLDNVGYMIPGTLVKQFLEEALHREYRGYPVLPVFFQKLENPSLRRYFGLEEETTGVFVADASMCEELQEGDIITRVDGMPIENDGSMYKDGIKRDLFLYALLEKHVGDTLQFDIIRRGIKKRCPVLVRNVYSDYFLLGPQDVEYFIYAGFVFEKYVYADFTSFIYIRKILPHDVNGGYEHYESNCIDKAGDVPLTSIEQLVNYLESDREFHILTLIDGRKIVLDELCKKKNKEVLDKFEITNDRFIAKSSF